LNKKGKNVWTIKQEIWIKTKNYLANQAEKAILKGSLRCWSPRWAAGRNQFPTAIEARALN
jgi:hypothetical protein